MRSFFLRRTRIDVCKSPITLEIDKVGVGTFHNQYSCDTGRPSAMNGKVKIFSTIQRVSSSIISLF